MMPWVRREGTLVILHLDAADAGAWQHLICVARPAGQAEHGQRRVVLHDGEPRTDIPIEHKAVEVK
jgi:hypothetical protein